MNSQESIWQHEGSILSAEHCTDCFAIEGTHVFQGEGQLELFSFSAQSVKGGGDEGEADGADEVVVDEEALFADGLNGGRMARGGMSTFSKRER